MAIKYLVINHEQTADVKTIIAYDTPAVPLGASFLNFDAADGDANTADISVVSTPVSGTNNFTHEVVVNFAWGGQTPIGTDFSLGTNTQFVRLKKTGFGTSNPDTGDVVVNVVSTAPNIGTGSVTLLFAENTDVAKTANLVFSDATLLTHPNQNAGTNQSHNILDITQNGQTFSGKKTS